MAVRESLRNIQELQTASLELKKQKEAELKRKEKQRQQKQDERETKELIKQEINFILYSEFAENLQKYGSTYIIEYYNINKKNALLGKIWSNHIVEKNIKLKNIEYTTKIIEYKEFINDHFNKIYYKILKEEENIQKNYETYIYYKNMQQQQQQQQIQQIQRMQQLQQQQQQQKIKIAKINNVINTIIILFLAILCFPIAIIIAACQKQK